jgi:hypothetical protein
MTTEPSVLRQCGLGANLIGNMDPISSFLLELLKEPATTAPSCACPNTIPQFHHNQTSITVVEVKDLTQTIAIQIGYGEMNVWME